MFGLLLFGRTPDVFRGFFINFIIMVYIDDMFNSPIGKFGRMKMSHMIADTTEELLAMADKIGVNRKWIQYPGTHREHFDVCMSKRIIAINCGAVAITWRETGEYILNRAKNSPNNNKKSD